MARGGVRKGAGRPAGKGPHGEATQPVRIPVSLLEGVAKYVARRGYKIPLYESHVQAGGPSPAEDTVDELVDLNEYLVYRPADTFMVRAAGESMVNAGILPGDMLLIDRSLHPANGRIVVAAVDGQLTVKRFHRDPEGIVSLLPENPAFEPIVMEEGNDLVIWGVVTSVIRQM